jgi:hypothetical protein
MQDQPYLTFLPIDEEHSNYICNHIKKGNNANVKNTNSIDKLIKICFFNFNSKTLKFVYEGINNKCINNLLIKYSILMLDYPINLNMRIHLYKLILNNTSLINNDERVLNKFINSICKEYI